MSYHGRNVITIIEMRSAATAIKILTRTMKITLLTWTWVNNIELRYTAATADC